jgi:hypothetical protein
LAVQPSRHWRLTRTFHAHTFIISHLCWTGKTATPCQKFCL